MPDPDLQKRCHDLGNEVQPLRTANELLRTALTGAADLLERRQGFSALVEHYREVLKVTEVKGDSNDG